MLKILKLVFCDRLNLKQLGFGFWRFRITGGSKSVIQALEQWFSKRAQRIYGVWSF